MKISWKFERQGRIIFRSDDPLNQAIEDYCRYCDFRAVDKYPITITGKLIRKIYPFPTKARSCEDAKRKFHLGYEFCTAGQVLKTCYDFAYGSVIEIEVHGRVSRFIYNAADQLKYAREHLS